MSTWYNKNKYELNIACQHNLNIFIILCYNIDRNPNGFEKKSNSLCYKKENFYAKEKINGKNSKK